MSVLGWVIIVSLIWVLVLALVVGIMATRDGDREGLRGKTVEHDLTEEERERIDEEARAFRVALRRVSPEDFDKGDDDYVGTK